LQLEKNRSSADYTDLQDCDFGREGDGLKKISSSLVEEEHRYQGTGWKAKKGQSRKHENEKTRKNKLDE